MRNTSDVAFLSKHYKKKIIHVLRKKMKMVFNFVILFFVIFITKDE